ncbi:hypothetical protein BURPS406E_C1598 [Burkholderia pseudomallei 406e]|nr:hypothetical protein BURPS406E_C1598 [Burkholderia pseudomallei 406e]
MAKQGDCATPFEHRPQSPAGRAFGWADAVRYRTGSGGCGRWSRKRRQRCFSESFPIEGLLIRCESIGN